MPRWPGSYRPSSTWKLGYAVDARHYGDGSSCPIVLASPFQHWWCSQIWFGVLELSVEAECLIELVVATTSNVFDPID